MQTAEVYVEFGGGSGGSGGSKVGKEDSRPRPSEFGIVPERVRTADPGKRIPKFKIDVSANKLVLLENVSPFLVCRKAAWISGTTFTQPQPSVAFLGDSPKNGFVSDESIFKV